MTARGDRLAWLIKDTACRSAGLNGDDVVVLLVLAECIGSRADWSIELNDLSEATGVSRRSLTRAVARLRARGLLVVTPGRQHMAATYRIDRSAVLALPRRASSHAKVAPLKPLRQANLASLATTQEHPAKPNLQSSQAKIDIQPSHPGPHPYIPCTDPCTNGSLALPGVATPDRPTPKKKAPEVTPGHRELVASFVEAFARIKGVKPELSARERKGANKILQNGKRPIAEAIEIVRRGLADPFVRDKKPSLAYIADNINAFLTDAPASSRDGRQRRGPGIQPSGDVDFAALAKAAAERGGT